MHNIMDKKDRIKIIASIMLVASLGLNFFWSNINKASAQTYTLADVALHNTASNCWMIINGKVYNVTAYIPQHPGGSAIVAFCGQDATQAFGGVSAHQFATTVLPSYYIGDLVVATPTPTPTSTPTPTPTTTPNPTATPTSTPTPTINPTPTPTPTILPSPTPTPTIQPTPSPIPTITPIPTPCDNGKSEYIAAIKAANDAYRIALKAARETFESKKNSCRVSSNNDDDNEEDDENDD